MGLSLRPYQIDGIKQIYSMLNEYDRIIFHLQTGGGKTITFLAMIKELVSWGANVVIVMRRRSVVNQTYPQLDKFGIDHGVYMAKHRRYSPSKKVQLCSIDTLGSRDIFPHSDDKNTIVIIDECHDCKPSGRKYGSLINAYSGMKIIGFTATPYDDNSFFQGVICPISSIELMKQGYLVPVKAYAPDIIDTSTVRINNLGQFDNDELFNLCSSSKVVGDAVKNWRKYSQGRRTIVFCVNIAHSKMMCEIFNKAGITSSHCDKDTSDRERRRILKMFKEGEVTCLFNVNVFSTGTDVVEIGCVQYLRPTRSLIFYLQSLGRGLRIAPHINKDNCILIDMAGNWNRFGSPYKEREVTFDKVVKQKGDIEDINVRRCKQCFFMMKATERICPDCGFENPKVERKGYEEVDGELVEVRLSEQEQEAIKQRELIRSINQLYWVQKKNAKLDISFIGWQLNKKFGKQYIDNNFILIDMTIRHLEGK